MEFGLYTFSTFALRRAYQQRCQRQHHSHLPSMGTNKAQRMKCPTLAFWVGLLAPVLVSAATPAQPTHGQYRDPSMIVSDRGSLLELIPTERGQLNASAFGHRKIRILDRGTSSLPMGPSNLGVVFNHTIQHVGFINGEITFQIKNGHRLDALSNSQLPGLRLVLKPNVYLVTARTPSEFLHTMRFLQTQAYLAWIEPNVIYTRADSQ